MAVKQETTYITLPYPPSWNQCYQVVRRGNGGSALILSSVGRSYKARVSRALRKRVGDSIDGDLAVSIDVWFPDRRRRDLDNLLKPILDVCTRGKVWADDVQVRDLHITLRGIKRGGRIQLAITPLERMLF